MFEKKVLDVLLASLNNFYNDNFDVELRRPCKIERLQILATRILRKISKIRGGAGNVSVSFSGMQNYYLDHLEQFKFLYEHLCDEESKNRFVELFVFRALGPLKVKLSLNTKAYWQGRQAIEQYQLADRLEVKNFRCNLSLFDLNPCGYDLKLYFAVNGIYVDFILQQYNYNDLVCVNQGDIVIDAGACWGDTTLYFASRGAKSVYSFEFIPSNLSVFEKNIALNPNLKEQIQIVKRPVWSESKVPLSYDDRGPASQVAEPKKYEGKTKTLSIDDLVKEQNIETVDFIKMDIEGAEMPALKGAVESIKRFKPKLAISVYHKPDDMIVIPEFIRSLNPGYKFYLDYYTIVGHEVMLYAIDENAL